MLNQNEMTDQKKQELKHNEEKTVPGKFYSPKTDIVETKNALEVTMDMPGVEKENLKINLEKNVLEVEGRINTGIYSDLSPVYSEYNIGHFSRKFSISNTIDQEGIQANVNDGVLQLILPKIPEAQPRQISVH